MRSKLRSIGWWWVVGVWHWLLQGPKDNQRVLPNKHKIFSMSPLMMVTSHFSLILGPELTWKLLESHAEQASVWCFKWKCESVLLSESTRHMCLSRVYQKQQSIEQTQIGSKEWWKLRKASSSRLVPYCSNTWDSSTSVAEASYNKIETTKRYESNTCHLECLEQFRRKIRFPSVFVLPFAIPD